MKRVDEGKLTGQKYILRGATWTCIWSWKESGKLWVRLRRDQDFYEEARPYHASPRLKRKLPP